MTSMLEDVVQALKNLGGQAILLEIYNEVQRIRVDPLSKSWQAGIRGTLEVHSPNSNIFNGKDLFRKIGPGTWALTDGSDANYFRSGKQKKIQQKSLGRQTREPQPITESFEIISNMFRTIREYRDYSNPATPAWQGYIQELFHLMHFDTEKLDERIFALKNMGDKHVLALVVYVQPGENFEYPLPGLSWESYLKYAANYYKIDWGVLTDGLKIKLFDYHRSSEPFFFSPDFDGILLQGKLDSFFTVYKQFATIKKLAIYGQNGQIDVGPQKNQVQNEGSLNGRKSHQDTLRVENPRIIFWEQLIDKAKTHGLIKGSKSPQAFNWISISSKKHGINYYCILRNTNAEVQLRIDRGDKNENKRIFTELYQQKDEIQKIFGALLDWNRLDTKQSSYIRFLISDYGFEDTEHWNELQDQFIDILMRLQRAFQPVINQIK